MPLYYTIILHYRYASFYCIATAWPHTSTLTHSHCTSLIWTQLMTWVNTRSIVRGPCCCHTIGCHDSCRSTCWCMTRWQSKRWCATLLVVSTNCIAPLQSGHLSQATRWEVLQVISACITSGRHIKIANHDVWPDPSFNCTSLYKVLLLPQYLYSMVGIYCWCSSCVALTVDAWDSILGGGRHWSGGLM